MPDRTLEEQLTKYLTDVHSIEVQAIAQLERGPDIAQDERLATAFREHLEETREQERRVRHELDERGADTSGTKDLAGGVGGWAMIAFAQLNPTRRASSRHTRFRTSTWSWPPTSCSRAPLGT